MPRLSASCAKDRIWAAARIGLWWAGGECKCSVNKLWRQEFQVSPVSAGLMAASWSAVLGLIRRACCAVKAPEDGIGLRWLGGWYGSAVAVTLADLVCFVLADLHGVGGSRSRQGVEAIRSARRLCRLSPVVAS